MSSPLRDHIAGDHMKTNHTICNNNAEGAHQYSILLYLNHIIPYKTLSYHFHGKHYTIAILC